MIDLEGVYNLLFRPNAENVVLMFSVSKHYFTWMGHPGILRAAKVCVVTYFSIFYIYIFFPSDRTTPYEID